MMNKALLPALRNAFAWILSATMFIPLLLVAVNSLKTKAEANGMNMSLPKAFQWSNYSIVIEEGKLIQSFFNSLLYACGATVGSILLASLAAYVFSRNRTRLNKAMYFYLIMGIAMPTNFVTLMKVMQWTHLVNTQTGIILMHGFVGSVPRELDEAGIVDGCSPIRLFLSVVIPLLMPVLVTVAILNFMGSWSDFIHPLYFLNNSDKWPMTLAVYNFFGRFQVNWNLVSADIVLTTLPVIVIYLLGQKFIISGMTAGSVKG
jgi:ABC-type sugar transport system, permease component